MDATTQQAGQRAAFTGNARQFFRTALIGYLLQLPTFGFYRFWLITDIRRHLWSHTRIGDESLEYTGRARELLIGFLIALAILTPIYVGYFLLGIEAELWQAFASIPLFLLIYVLMHYGTYRARRYRATRTIFRGVRLWMTGSGWAYAARAVAWDLLTIVSLGIALPWREAALERFRMRNTHFGDLQGAFAGRGWVLFKRGWWLWLISGVPLLVLLPTLIVMLLMDRGRIVTPPVEGNIVIVLIGVSLLLWLPASVIGLPFYRAISTRWRLEGIRFGEFFMTCDLRKRSVLLAYVKAMVIGGVVTGVMGIILQMLAEGFGFSWEGLGDGKAPPFAVIIAFGVFYILVALAMAVVMLQIVTRGIWELTVHSVTVFNLAALDAATARGAAAGSLGEGLADALDFGSGIGV